MTYTNEQLQRARDFAADAYIAAQIADAVGMVSHSYGGSFEAWGKQIDDYSRFMRQGAYDSDMAVQAALAALLSVEQEASQ